MLPWTVLDSVNACCFLLLSLNRAETWHCTLAESRPCLHRLSHSSYTVNITLVTQTYLQFSHYYTHMAKPKVNNMVSYSVGDFW